MDITTIRQQRQFAEMLHANAAAIEELVLQVQQYQNENQALQDELAKLKADLDAAQLDHAHEG